MRQHSMSFSSATGSQQSSEMLGGVCASEDGPRGGGGKLELEPFGGGVFFSQVGKEKFHVGMPQQNVFQGGVRALGVFI